MSRYLRSGVLWFWALVVAAMAVVGVFAVLAGPTETPRPHPRVTELFDDAVDVRHTLALVLRTGDVTPLRTHVDALVERWDPAGAPDHHAARGAAVATLERLGEHAAAEQLDTAWRDRLVAEADLLAALAADPADPALIALAEAGFDAGAASLRPERPEPVTFDDAETRLSEIVARGGVTTLPELRNRLSAHGAPQLPAHTDPALRPPSPEDLPR